MNAKNTSRVRQRHQSAVDNRISAIGVGILGVSLMVIAIAVIVGMDAATLMSHIVFKIRRHQKKSLELKFIPTVEEGRKGFRLGQNDGTLPDLPDDRSHAPATGMLASAVPNRDSSNDWSNLEAETENSGYLNAVDFGNDEEERSYTYELEHAEWPQYRGSRRKHLLHVRPETILLHVRNWKQGNPQSVDY